MSSKFLATIYTSWFAQSIDNQAYLCGSEATGSIRKSDAIQPIHQVGIVMNPDHQFLAGCRSGDVRTIQLCKFSFTVCAYSESGCVHFLLFLFYKFTYFQADFQAIRCLYRSLSRIMFPYRKGACPIPLPSSCPVVSLYCHPEDKPFNH